MANEHKFTSPVGRYVGGNLYEGKTTDGDNKPLVYKSGAKMGQPRVEFSFAVAYPKTPGATHWANEAWLAPVWQLAHAAFPQGEAQRRDFSFKIIDGDSTEPNKKMKRPCDQEGYPGHWVVWFSGSTAPRVCNADGSQIIAEPGAVKRGYYVQVLGSVADNKPSPTPGLYWNHSAVALSAFGPEISSGPDIGSAGFGQNVALPAGASTTPPAGMAVGAPPPPPAPAVPGVTPGPNLSSVSPPAPVGVTPPNAVGAKVMSTKATSQGLTYASFNVGAPGSPWTDALLVQEGYMMAPVVQAPPPPLVPGGSAPVPSPGAPIAVVPNPQFTQVPAPGAPAGLPPLVPAAAVGPTMTAKATATGMTYAQLLAMPGWNEQLLRQEGYIL